MGLNEAQKQAILDAGHKVVLDGSASHKDLLTPYDAHEQAARSSDGYEHQEFPKAIAHTEDGAPVIAKDAKHEAELIAEANS